MSHPNQGDKPNYQSDKIHTSDKTYTQGTSGTQPLGVISQDPNVQSYQNKDIKDINKQQCYTGSDQGQQWQQGKQQGLYGQPGVQGQSMQGQGLQQQPGVQGLTGNQVFSGQGVQGQQFQQGQQQCALKLHHPYIFTALTINHHAMKIFHKNDKNADWLLTLPETRHAVIDFCKLHSHPEPTDDDFQTLFQLFDHDHSGLIDFGEFRMMLELMGGVVMYTPQQIIEARTSRNARIQECKVTPL